MCQSRSPRPVWDTTPETYVVESERCWCPLPMTIIRNVRSLPFCPSSPFIERTPVHQNPVNWWHKMMEKNHLWIYWFLSIRDVSSSPQPLSLTFLTDDTKPSSRFQWDSYSMDPYGLLLNRSTSTLFSECPSLLSYTLPGPRPLLKPLISLTFLLPNLEYSVLPDILSSSLFIIPSSVKSRTSPTENRIVVTPRYSPNLLLY